MRVSSSGGPNNARCRKMNNNRISKDITKHTFIDLLRNWSTDCINHLVKIGLSEIISIDEIKHYYDFFIPKRHIPPNMSTFNMNMSTIERKTFEDCQ